MEQNGTKIVDEFSRMGMFIKEQKIQQSIDRYFATKSISELLTQTVEKAESLFVENMMFEIFHREYECNVFVTETEKFKEKLGFSENYGEITENFFRFLRVNYFTYFPQSRNFRAFFDLDELDKVLLDEETIREENLTHAYKGILNGYHLKKVFTPGEEEIESAYGLLLVEIREIENKINENEVFQSFMEKVRNLLVEEFEERVACLV